MDGCGDAACDRVVDTGPWSVRWITDHNATESLFAHLATKLVKNFDEDNAPEDIELGRVGH
jgi:hypothetical protein